MLTFQELVALGARRFLYVGSAVIPAAPAAGAAGNNAIQIQVTNDAHFLSEFVTMTFTTQDTGGGGQFDTGTSAISLSLKDGSSNLSLCSDFMDIATVATPGRQRVSTITGDPSLPLHIQGLPFVHIWESTGIIFMDLRNNSGFANTVQATWQGWKIPLDSLTRLKQIMTPYNIAAMDSNRQ